jgi:ribosomal protein L17
MKTMTCKQLAGACDKEFHAETFEELAEMCRKHAMEMVQNGDKAHLEKMKEMKDLMNNPEAVKEWFEKIQKEFDALPEDK